MDVTNNWFPDGEYKGMIVANADETGGKVIVRLLGSKRFFEGVDDYNTGFLVGSKVKFTLLNGKACGIRDFVISDDSAKRRDVPQLLDTLYSATRPEKAVDFGNEIYGSYKKQLMSMGIPWDRYDHHWNRRLDQVCNHFGTLPNKLSHEAWGLVLESLNNEVRNYAND